MKRATSSKTYKSYITMTRTTCFIIFALLILQVSSNSVRIRRQNSWTEVNRRTTTVAPSSDPSTTTTASPQFVACFNACRTTPEYNPVCASNRITYDNEGKMRCAVRCGLNIQKMFGGTCSPL